MRNFSPDFHAFTEAAWQFRRKRLGEAAEAWEHEIQGSGDIAPLLRYVLATLPLTDLGEYPTSLFAGFVRHACRVDEEFAWCQDLPEHLFLKDVLYPRINTEELADCCPLFYEELAPRVQGLTLPEAILEVNRWCAEHVTYRSTDDRTSSPLAVYRRGWGRCGEESTFTVTALRSVGIPARQVYAPWWSHCDDNHAWVEAWDGENWRYLGACEPEPELDRGWFTSAAARAMLIHARSFVGDLPAPAWLFPGVDGLCLDVREGVAYESLTRRYAPTRACTVTVREPDGSPAAGARLTFSVLNMAAYREIARRVADEGGQARLELGLGSLLVTAEKDGRMTEGLWDTAHSGELALCLPDTGASCPAARSETSYIFTSPPAPETFPAPLTPEQKARRKAVLEQAEVSRRRKQRKVAKSKKEDSERLPGRVADLLNERAALLSAPPPEGFESFRKENLRKARLYADTDPAALTEKVLALLTRKDRSEDIDPRVIVQCAPALHRQGELPEDAFAALLNPRVGREPLRPWYGMVYFSEEMQSSFLADPRQIWSWVERRPLTGSYEDLPQSPLAALSLQAAGAQGRRAQFCMLCRQLGIPARLSALDGEPEYWQDGRFVRLHGEPDACLHLTAPADRPAVWGQAYTLSRWERGQRLVLSTGNLPAGESRALPLPAGHYRLLTVLRLPSGNQLVRQEDFSLAAGQEREIALHFPLAEPSRLLQHRALPPFFLTDPAGHSRPGREILAGAPLSLLCWLEPGREPTEHLLLELEDAAAGFGNRQKDCRVYLITPPEAGEDPALTRTMNALPGAQLWHGDFEEVPGLARQLFTDPERLPLVLLADRQGQGLYACSGYNVGVTELLLRLLDSARPGKS